MSKCYICNRKTSKTSDISFHGFPADEKSKQTWFEIIGRSDPPGKRSTVCSLHFTKDCFRYGLVYGNRRIKEGSNPSLYLTETEEETIMLNKRHSTSVNQTLDDVINHCKRADSDAEENSENLQTEKPNLRRNKYCRRKGKLTGTMQEEIKIPAKKLRLNLTWEKISSAPDGGKRHWESARKELRVRRNRINNLEDKLRHAKEKLLEIQTLIKDLKGNPYVSIYV